MSLCLNCGGEVENQGAHRRGDNYRCPPRMEEAPGRAPVVRAVSDDLLPLCLGSEEEEKRFLEFWAESGAEITEHQFSPRAAARAVWAAAKRDCVK